MPFSVPGDFAETAFSCNQKFMSYTRYILAMVPGLGLAFIMSQFLRSIPAVIAPDLRAELDLTAGQLSNLPAALFLGSALMQLPAGVPKQIAGPRYPIILPGPGTQ